MAHKKKAQAKTKKVFQWQITTATTIRAVYVEAAREGSDAGCAGDAPSCADNCQGSEGSCEVTPLPVRRRGTTLLK